MQKKKKKWNQMICSQLTGQMLHLCGWFSCLLAGHPTKVYDQVIKPDREPSRAVLRSDSPHFKLQALQFDGVTMAKT